MDDPRRIAGLVELVEQEEKKAFTGIEELVDILVHVPGKTTRTHNRNARQSRD